MENGYAHRIFFTNKVVLKTKFKQNCLGMGTKMGAYAAICECIFCLSKSLRKICFDLKYLFIIILYMY